MSEERIKVDLKLRRCLRCGHWECTHCRKFCDDGACIWPEDTDYVFPEGKSPCHDLRCEYDAPIDKEGYKRFDALVEKREYEGDITEEDGTVYVVKGLRS